MIDIDLLAPCVVAASLISAAIGFAGAALMAGHKIRRASIESWKAARIYYTHDRSRL